MNSKHIMGPPKIVFKSGAKLERLDIRTILEIKDVPSNLQSRNIHPSVHLYVYHRNPSASQNCSYWPLSLSTIEPIDHWAYQPSTQCPQTIKNRAPFKASFVDLLVLYRFLVISDFDVWILVQLITDLVNHLRFAVCKWASNKIWKWIYSKLLRKLHQWLEKNI